MKNKLKCSYKTLLKNWYSAYTNIKCPLKHIKLPKFMQPPFNINTCSINHLIKDGSVLAKTANLM